MLKQNRIYLVSTKPISETVIDIDRRQVHRYIALTQVIANIVCFQYKTLQVINKELPDSR